MFGTECYVNVLKKFRTKLNDKAVLGNFVAYVNEEDGINMSAIKTSSHQITLYEFSLKRLCVDNKTVHLVNTEETGKVEEVDEEAKKVK